MGPSHIDQPVVIFLHIPKTAGSTLYDILKRRYPKTKRADLSNDTLDSFARLPREKIAQVKMIRGHIPYGIHNSLAGTFTYITILRQPVERILSLYYFILRRPDHYLYNNLAQSKMTLDAFVSSGMTTELDNSQVRLIAGVGNRLPFGQCSQDHLGLAIQHLDTHFSFCGLSERFDESLIVLRRALGWTEYPLYRKVNVTRDRPSLKDIDPSILQKIERQNGLDMELYNLAQSRLDACISEIPEMDEELHLFKEQNATYQKISLPGALLEQVIKNTKNTLRNTVRRK